METTGLPQRVIIENTFRDNKFTINTDNKDSSLLTADYFNCHVVYAPNPSGSNTKDFPLIFTIDPTHKNIINYYDSFVDKYKTPKIRKVFREAIRNLAKDELVDQSHIDNPQFTFRGKEKVLKKMADFIDSYFPNNQTLIQSDNGPTTPPNPK